MDARDRLLSQREVSQMIGFSEAWLEKERFKGNTALPFCKIGRAVRYRLSDIQNYIDSFQTSSQTPNIKRTSKAA